MSAVCGTCGSALPHAMLEGLCPRCIAKNAFGIEEKLNLRFGKYEVVRELGRGGAGVVYLARQTGLNRLVAVKLLTAGAHAGSAAVERFLREAREASKLRHPHIVAIHEIDFAGELPFYSMDFVEGEDLAAFASRTRLSPRAAAALVEKAAHAVQHAHDAGVLHRDLKPSNLLIDVEGEPHLTDFGLARTTAGSDGLTLTGEVMGSPGYIAPEQLRGEATRATDVFGLGAVLYFLLTGRPPFVAAQLAELLAAVDNADPVPPRRLDPSIPRDLETITLRALARSPTDRYASAADLAADLGRWAVQLPIEARPVSGAERAWRWARRNKKLSLLAAALLAALVFGAVGVIWQWRRAESAAQEIAVNLYSADLRVASDALLAGNLGLARQTLEACPPELRDLAWGLLHPMATGDAETEIGSAQWTVTHLAVSRDGLQAATTSQADNVRIWDLAANKLIAELTDTSTGWWAEFSPDGKQLFTATKTVQLWDLSQRRVIREFPGMSGALSPDGRILYTCTGHRFVWEGETGVVAAWNVADGSRVFAVPLQARSLELSPDGTKLAVSNSQTEIAVYDARDGRELIKPWPSEERLWDLTFSPDGSLLVASGWSNKVRVWNLREPVPSCRVLAHPSVTWATAFSNGGEALAVGCSDRQVHLWDTNPWKQRRTLRGHENEVWSVAWQRDGLLLSSGRDPRLLRWQTDAPVGMPRLHHDLNSFSLAFLPDARIASSHTLPDGNLSATVESLRGGAPKESFPGETPLAFDSVKNRLWLWTPERRLRSRPASQLNDYTDLEWPMNAGEEIVDSPTLTVSAGLGWAALKDGSLILHRLTDGKRIKRITNVFAHHLPIAALSPDGRWFVWGGASTELSILDLQTGTRTRLNGHRYEVSCIAFSPGGKTFVTGGTDGLLYSWQTSGDHRRALIGQHLTSVGQLVFSSDGKVLISHEPGAGLHVWHVEKAREVSFIEARDNGDRGWVGVSPDERWVGFRRPNGDITIMPIATPTGLAP